MEHRLTPISKAQRDALEEMARQLRVETRHTYANTLEGVVRAWDAEAKESVEGTPAKEE